MMEDRFLFKTTANENHKIHSFTAFSCEDGHVCNVGCVRMRTNENKVLISIMRSSDVGNCSNLHLPVDDLDTAKCQGNVKRRGRFEEKTQFDFQ